MYRRLYYLGYLGYLSLFILSLVFYKERTIFTDIAYHLFHILREDKLAIQNFRYGAAATQVVPLVAGKLHVGLNGIALLYSSGFIIYYTLCYFLCGTVFKNHKIALALLLASVFFATDTFYWMQSELPQGLAFMMVFFAFLSNKTPVGLKPPAIAMMAFSIVTIVFFHPLMIFPFTFAVLFFSLGKDPVMNRKLLFASMVFFVLVFLVKKYLFATTYESQAMVGVDKILESHYLDLYSHKRFLLNCLTRYYWIPLVSVGAFLFYIHYKEWTKAALVTVFMLAYLLLVNITYQSPDVQRFYIENLYLPMGIFLALPLVYDLLPLIAKRSYLPYGIVAMVIITAVARISLAHGPYTSRLDWQRAFLKEHATEKLVVAESAVPMDTLMMTWGTPFEFWLLSTIEQKQTACVIISNDAEGLLWAMGDPKRFITQWGVFAYSEFPREYFVFRDTTNGYNVIR